MISIVPIILFGIFLNQDYYSKTTRRVIIVLYCLLLVAIVATKFLIGAQGYNQYISGFTTVFSILIYYGIGSTKVKKPGEKLSFNCPFCESNVQFPDDFKDESKNCPSCNQVIKVTEDKEFHKSYKESHEAILAAMDSEDLQEDSSLLKDPETGSSVFGQPFKTK